MAFRRKQVYLLITGKRPLSVFFSEAKAKEMLVLMKKMNPKSIKLEVRVEKVEVQD